MNGQLKNLPPDVARLIRDQVEERYSSEDEYPTFRPRRPKKRPVRLEPEEEQR